MQLKDLPKVLPLYAVPGVILLPRTQLPLMIQGFEDEAIVDYALITKASVNYEGYEKDLEICSPDPFVNRPHLLKLLKEYLHDQDIAANWDEIDHASDDLILNSLTMACPFGPLEKQALLESSTLSERCDMMIALMEMAHAPFQGDGPVLH